MHERAIFPDFSAFQMTMTGAAEARRTAEAKTGETPALTPPGAPPGLGAGPVPEPFPAAGPAAPAHSARPAAPPFSWLGSDAWPTFPSSQAKGG